MKTKDNRRVILAMLAAVGGNAIWGISSMFSRVAVSLTSPAVLLCWRFWISLIVLSVYALVKKIPVGVSVKSVKWLLLLGLFQPMLNFSLETYGIAYSSAAFCGIMQAMSPIAGLILGFLLLREKPAILQILFSVISVAGVLILTIASNGTGIATWLGAFLLFSAIIFATVYFLLSRKFSAELTTFQRTYYMTLTGVIFFTVWSLVQNRNSIGRILEPGTHPEFILSVLFLGIFSTMIAYLLLNYATSHLTAARFTAFTSLTTITSVLSGVLILKEPFLPVMIPTTVMVIVGTWGVQRFTQEQKEEKSERGGKS